MRDFFFSLLQVHRTPDGTFTVFSRRSENSTGKYPDLAGILSDAANPGTHSCIVDGEVRSMGYYCLCVHECHHIVIPLTMRKEE